nr:hypothetical protein [Tanacetum cinerariifolium]
MMTDRYSSAAGSKPITSFIRTRPAESKIQATLLGLNNTFLFVEKIIKVYTGQRPIHIQEACFEHTKKCFEDRVIPFFDMFKIHVMHCEQRTYALLCLLLKGKCFQDRIACVKNFNPLAIGNTQEYLNLKLRLRKNNKCLQYLKTKILSYRSKTKIAQLKEGLTSLKIQNDGTSPRSTQKPPVQHKKLTVPVNTFPKAKPAIEARKPIPKRNIQNHNPLPAKSVKARRAADYYRNLYVDIIARIVPIWKPTGRRFNLHDIFGSRTSTKPIVKPSKLTPCISPSTNATLSLEPILEQVKLSPSVSSCASSTITMVSWFSDYRLSDRKAGSNGMSSIFY